ncbi:hypothetical protein EO95_02790 [Methanosarcina sp. 1.H.T.1A.1]|nr:hypothetical protein EO93_18130 [Methanosarcina sp. 1.H.A.2.2]KKH92334.1 hypothetical protein EO95_02790 [Methanosarcina sp. 1.H.T.1A.1]
MKNLLNTTIPPIPYFYFDFKNRGCFPSDFYLIYKNITGKSLTGQALHDLPGPEFYRKSFRNLIRFSLLC